MQDADGRSCLKKVLFWLAGEQGEEGGGRGGEESRTGAAAKPGVQEVPMRGGLS